MSDASSTVRIRYQIRFAKTGLLRWIGHQDLARLWERMTRRADLKPSMTEGFHPKPRIAFPSALALGIEGTDEVVDLDLAEELSTEELKQRLIDDEQPGLEIHSVVRLPMGVGKSQLVSTDYEITPPSDLDTDDKLDAELASVAQAIERLLAAPTLSIQRKKKTVTLETATQIDALEIKNHRMHLSLLATATASLRPGDVLDLLGLDDWIQRGATIVRTGVHLNEYESVTEKQ